MKWLILFDENYLRGGLQTCCREIGSLVLKHGGEVDFAFTRKNPFEDLAADHPNACRVSCTGPLPTRSLRLRSLRGAWRILRSSRPDVLFFCTTGAPNFAPFLFLAPLAGISRRIVQFGTEVASPDDQYGVRAWGREFHASARLAYRFMTLGLFNNEPQMRKWITGYGLGEDRCKVWNYPVDLSRFRPYTSRDAARSSLGFAANDFIIGGVGALNAQKSFHVAVNALAEVRSRIPNARLVIAGEGDRESLEHLAIELGVADRLHLLGERDDIPTLMNAFDVFCIPSTHPNETLGIAFVEAQACGVPIVVPDLPGPRRVAGDGTCGIVVPKGSHTALADAWHSIHCDPARQRQLSEAGIEAAKAFDRDTVFRRLLAELRIEMLIGERPNSGTAPALSPNN